MSINQGVPRGRGRPPDTSVFELPRGLQNRLDFSGFFDPLAAEGAAIAAPPEAVDFNAHDRFRAAYVRYGVILGSLERVPAELGRSWKQIQRYLRGGDIPLEATHAVAAGAKVPVDWLLTGRGVESIMPGVVNVRTASIRPSAGGGSVLVESEEGTVPLPQSLFVRLGIRPAMARLLAARGSSMSPTIDDGDWMLIDTENGRRLEPKSGLVYVLSVGDAVFVKRLTQAADGTWIMHSDNEMVDPRDVPLTEEFRVNGRVVWVGHAL